MKLPRRVREAIVAHARDADPAECCGLLVGGDERVLEAVRAHNLETSPNRFLIDPQDHIDALRRARSRGLEVVGFYHSHPHSPAYPSPSDLAEAQYPDCVHLIVSLQGGLPEVRAFRFDHLHVVEVDLADES